IAIENVRELRRRNARTGIDDRDTRAAAIATQPHHDVRRRRRVLECVVEQIRYNALDPQRIEMERDWLPRIEHNTRSIRSGDQALDHVLEQCAEFRRLTVELELSTRDRAAIEQIQHEPIEECHIVIDARDRVEPAYAFTAYELVLEQDCL